MREKGFTLIEVMVVMAIISILAGMMMPAIWKYWESEEIATTRERMREIKKGLVGDKNLVQNGVRTQYGFVGDNGDLPFQNLSASGGLSYLVSRPTGGYPNWNGPYLSGFGPDWNKDAWGKTFSYTLTKDAYGRYVSAELRSAGPDGIFGNTDDIVDLDVQVSETEITAVNSILTNIPNNTGSEKSLNLNVSFKDPTVNSNGITAIPSACVSFQGFENSTTLTISPKRLPVGGVEIAVNRYSSDNCVDLHSTSNYRYFVTGNMNRIILNNSFNNP